MNFSFNVICAINRSTRRSPVTDGTAAGAELPAAVNAAPAVTAATAVISRPIRVFVRALGCTVNLHVGTYPDGLVPPLPTPRPGAPR